MRQIFSMMVFMFFTGIAVSQSGTLANDSIAREYMKAYGKWDFDKMKTFYHDDVYFIDITGKEAFGINKGHNGKEAVHTFFRGIFKDLFTNDKPSYVSYPIDKIYTSGSFVIVSGTFECFVPNKWFQKEITNEKILISIPFTTILKFQDGLIIEHIDYGGYDTYFKQIRAQLKQ